MPQGPTPTTVVREELVRVRAGKGCDKRAELAGLLRSAGTFHVLPGPRYALEATTENAGVARRLYEALADALGTRAELRLLEPGRGHPHKRYLVHAEARTLQMLVEAGVLDEKGSPDARIPRRLVSRRCCAGAFLRGAFLARGSVSDPRRAAHLEIRTGEEASAEALADLMRDVGAARPQTRAHRGGWVVYLKEGAAIGTVLASMGAHQAYLAWEDGAVWKAVHVEASRLANADAANALRLARACVKQLAVIDELDARMGLAALPRALREVAELRRAHPDASIEELGRACTPPITKAAVAGRFRRLSALAADAG